MNKQNQIGINAVRMWAASMEKRMDDFVKKVAIKNKCNQKWTKQFFEGMSEAFRIVDKECMEYESEYWIKKERELLKKS